MFLIDDILMAPANGLFAVFRELHEAARQESANEADSIRGQLSELYMMLETAQLTEQEFDDREHALLDRLDELESRGTEVTEEEDLEDEEEFVEVEGTEEAEEVEEVEEAKAGAGRGDPA